MDLYQHKQIQVVSSCCSSDIFDLEILQSDWLRAFWLISEEPDFSEIWDLYRNIEYFHYRPLWMH